MPLDWGNRAEVEEQFHKNISSLDDAKLFLTQKDIWIPNALWSI